MKFKTINELYSFLYKKLFSHKVTESESNYLCRRLVLKQFQESDQIIDEVSFKILIENNLKSGSSNGISNNKAYNLTDLNNDFDIIKNALIKLVVDDNVLESLINVIKYLTIDNNVEIILDLSLAYKSFEDLIKTCPYPVFAISCFNYNFITNNSMSIVDASTNFNPKHALIIPKWVHDNLTDYGFNDIISLINTSRNNNTVLRELQKRLMLTNFLKKFLV